MFHSPYLRPRPCANVLWPTSLAFQLCQRFPEGSATKSTAGSLCNNRGVHPGGEREKATEMKVGAVGCLNAQALMLVTFKTPDGGAERRFQDEYTRVTADQVEGGNQFTVLNRGVTSPRLPPLQTSNRMSPSPLPRPQRPLQPGKGNRELYGTTTNYGWVVSSRSSGDIQHQLSLQIETAVNSLIRGTQASL